MDAAYSISTQGNAFVAMNLCATATDLEITDQMTSSKKEIFSGSRLHDVKRVSYLMHRLKYHNPMTWFLISYSKRESPRPANAAQVLVLLQRVLPQGLFDMLCRCLINTKRRISKIELFFGLFDVVQFNSMIRGPQCLAENPPTKILTPLYLEFRQMVPKKSHWHYIIRGTK